MSTADFAEFIVSDSDLPTVLLCVALTAANKPDKVASVVQELLSVVMDHDQQLERIERIRHAIFKSTAFCGFPRVINAEMALFNELGPEQIPYLRAEPANLPKKENYERGMRLYKKIYSNQAQAKTEAFKKASPELWPFVEYYYGNVLSDTTHLSESETQLLILVNHMIMETIPQLSDHLSAARRMGVLESDIELAQKIVELVK